MPELPEVETVRLGISPTLIQQTITRVEIRNHQLRWPITADLARQLTGLTILDIQRRGKYLLFMAANGALVLHLGMSGRVHLLSHPAPTAKKHDHVDMLFSNQWTLRYTDPRRFGCLLWAEHPVFDHPLLILLGPEPLSSQFNGNYLFKQAAGRKTPVKSFIMDSQIVVGIGNIYANEALFAAKISPLALAGTIEHSHYQILAKACKHILKKAIKAGGTTLNDFQNARGEPGYFSQELLVYGREDQPCPRCHTTLTGVRIGQRSTVYCPKCQKI